MGCTIIATSQSICKKIIYFWIKTLRRVCIIKKKKSFLCLRKYSLKACSICIISDQMQRKNMMVSQNLCTLLNNLNQNFYKIVSIVQVRIKKIVKISLNNKDYKKLDIYYYSQIVAALASLISILKSLFRTRFILIQKVQTKKGLSALKVIRYKM